MPVDRVQRKVAAILAADVVGFSRLVGKDEETTLATLKVHRQAIDKLIAGYDGRIFGSAGDSVIAEFASAIGAVRCAIDIQLAIDRLNADLPGPGRMRFRIGVNLGDVVVDGDNLMGDGVNVAARLEGLALPGGICVSDAIQMQVRDRLAADFVDLGEQRLKNIARPVRAFRVPVTSEEPTSSPFRGLDSFDFEHADLFFGRSRAIAICTERLEQLAVAGKCFLLIYGMSGSGKSSLVRAGLIPAVTQRGAVPGILLWRRCVMRPSEGPDAITSLSAALLRAEALPELAENGTATELAATFRNNPDRALAFVRSALASTPSSGGPGKARLVLAVDQMEELFTIETEPASRALFVRLLSAFATSGLVWVIATIRGDFFHRCGEVPGFSALKDGLSSYELLPPTGAEISKIIREPASAAGLRFEETKDRGRLEDVLQEATAADPGSLPLLEFVLEALYQAGRAERLLTFAAYRALGGLEGAIARRADEVVEALSPTVQDALPTVLRALTTVRLGDNSVAAAPAVRDNMARTPAQAALLDALIAARLLVSDENLEGQAVVRVAHEALLSRWPRARDIVNADRSFLETRARLRTDAGRWHADNRNPDLLLPAGIRLAEGEELLVSRREDVDDQVAQYVEASLLAQMAVAERERQADRARIEAEEATKRERLEREAERRSLVAEAATRLARRTRYAAIVAFALAVVAGAGAIAGFWGQHEASLQAERADENAQEAIAARDLALRNQSRSLSSISLQLSSAGDSELAILLALEALPKKGETTERPYVTEAEAALFRALSGYQELAVLRHEDAVTHGAFSPEGDRVVTSSFDQTARVWNTADGKALAILKGHKGVLKLAVFSPDGRQVLTGSVDGTARVWDAATGKHLYVLNQTGDVHAAIFSRDGTRIFTASEFAAPTIWNARDGTEIARLPGASWQSTVLAVSPDGQMLASVQFHGDVQIWNANDGTPIGTIPVRGDNVTGIEFSPNGTQLLTVAWTGTSRLWSLADLSGLAALPGSPSAGHQGTFSHDGRLVAVVAIDGSARLWNTRTGELIRIFGQETRASALNAGISYQYLDVNGAFSPDGELFATASVNGVSRIWDVKSGSQVSILHGHSALIEEVAFSPDGRRLLTVSHDGTARIWDVDGVLTTTLRHETARRFAVFSADGARVVTGSGVVGHVWDVASGNLVATLAPGTEGLLKLAVFSPDGHRLATTSNDGVVRLWEAKGGREAAALEGHDPKVVQVQFSSDGSFLASASVDGTVRLWDASTGAAKTVFQTTADLQDALFSPDGKLVLATLNDNTARLWKMDGTEITGVPGHENRISAAAFSPDSRLVAIGSSDGTTQIWSVAEGEAAATLKGHGGPVTNVAFSNDGRSLATASRDGTVRIWSVKDGKERSVLTGGSASIDNVALSPNGQYAVTSSYRERSVRLWSADTGQQLALLVGQHDTSTIVPAVTRAAFNSDGTQVAAVSGGDSVQLIRVFTSPEDLIAYAQDVVHRKLTSCERRRFFLPVADDAEDCPS
ncbi:AAA family ATPase [Mesorhizobium sp. M0898]|uniref:nSTAND1 domain-containing NTPase n=1 Tax=Mesorhizobium sp. M0898 TaxID=2957020 RepID=UPI0033357F2F